MNRGELLQLLELIQQFDETVASDEPSHLACIVIGMHCNAVLDKMTG